MRLQVKRGILPMSRRSRTKYSPVWDALVEAQPGEWLHVDIDIDSVHSLRTSLAPSNIKCLTIRRILESGHSIRTTIRFPWDDDSIPDGMARLFFQKYKMNNS